MNQLGILLVQRLMETCPTLYRSIFIIATAKTQLL